jgi:hypothetical protein
MTSDRLISTATQIQRWRDFLSQVTAYVVGNLILIGIWAASGRGTLGPLVAAGLGSRPLVSALPPGSPRPDHRSSGRRVPFAPRVLKWPVPPGVTGEFR